MKDFSLNSFAAGGVFGILLACAWFYGGTTALPPIPFTSPVLETSELPTQQEREQSGALSIVDQPAGDTVSIESVTVPPPGVWIAVREVEEHDGDLGNVLGALRVTGPRTSVSVPLLRATKAERPYAVELYRDDNIGTFDPAINSVYVDFDTGAPVVVYFSTTL